MTSINHLNEQKTVTNKKVVRAWTFYDWANSAYSLIITSAIFPMYYTAIVPETISFLGIEIKRAAMASYSISLSFLVIAMLSPILSSIADYYGNKKAFMRFFCYLGALACLGMFFFSKNPITGNSNYFYGLICSVIASIGYCGSIVFYNAFLPEICSKEEQDQVSAKGFSMGYIGSVLLMLLCFALILSNDQYHFFKNDAMPARLSFVAVGIWWIVFAQITFHHLHESKREHSLDTKRNGLMNGYRELQKVLHELQHWPQLKRFLVAFFFYNLGVQTVMYMATYFASDELHMEATQLLAVVLIIQLVAIIGAFLFSKISKQYGNQMSLLLLIIVWIGICVAAYYVQTVQAFYLLAFAVGMVMGGIQSLSRSTYSKLLPPTGDTASYFSFYDVCEKIGIVIGTLSFGFVADRLGGMRNSVMVIGLCFVIGLLLLLRVSNKQFLQHESVQH